MILSVSIFVLLAAGACLQSVIGFGFGLLCVPLAYLLMPELVPGPMIIAALVITGLLAIQHRKMICFNYTVGAVLGGSVGIAIATAVISIVQPSDYRFLLGVVILVAVLCSCLGMVPPLNSFSNLCASFLSGFMGVTSAAGGAPMGLLYQSMPREQSRANLNVFFLYVNIIGAACLWGVGSFNLFQIDYLLICIPPVFIGWLIGQLITARLNEILLKRLVLLSAAFSGVWMVSTSLF
ncbi:sulfite exporter TauE/SafE family protein [Neiella sp. HB171785]|uniref:Probable membrane transporter protein n=1 Tax=Neiella litorisoli TaxID=2771431 RepID=A0A8J6QQ24_9GAMM|nr:sulfite exporter TauE/SafE family protein [Neiella litorisoli]